MQEEANMQEKKRRKKKVGEKSGKGLSEKIAERQQFKRLEGKAIERKEKERYWEERRQKGIGKKREGKALGTCGRKIRRKMSQERQLMPRAGKAAER